MKNAFRIKLAASIIVAAVAAPSFAATEGSILTVSTNITNTCAIGDGTLSFGNNGIAVNPDGTAGTTANVDTDSGSSISMICTNGAIAAITADGGANAVGAVRSMKSGTDLLAYELYTDGTRTTVLDATHPIAYTGTGAATTTTSIFGRIAAADLQGAKNGSYSDTVALTITYTP